MNIHIITPFAIDKNLGRAYNNSIRLLPEDDWVCLMDYDAMFLLPEQIKRMYDYITAYPNTTLFVCYGSRVHDLSPQSFGHIHENNFDFKHHIEIAKKQLLKGLVLKQILRPVGGFLMLFPKKTWHKYKFREDAKCLTVDTHFSKSIMLNKDSIYLMESIYIWHSYRIMTGKKDITHLL
jgi:glycosyltransferase involved in cell wall biosynthesis